MILTNQVLLIRVCLFKNITKSCTFLPHRAKEIRPPSSSPAGMLLMALIRSPAQAQITRGLIEIAVPSLRTLPRSSFAKKVNKNGHYILIKVLSTTSGSHWI